MNIMARKTVEERLADVINLDINAYERATSYSRKELLQMVNRFITLELNRIEYKENK